MTDNKLIRNLKYNTAPDTMYCGENGKCDPNYKQVTCSGDENRILAGYIWKEADHSSVDCILGHKDFFVKDPLSIDEDVWNPTLAKYNQNKDKYINDVLDCCYGNLTDIQKMKDCGNLWLGKDVDNSCKVAIKDYCKKDLTNMDTERCKDWCYKDENISECKDKLRQLCVNKNPNTAPKICSCFYDPTFYANIRQKISDMYNVPEELFGGGRSCYFPDCQASRFKDDIYDCPALNLTTCISKIDVDASNSKITGLTIKNTQECNSAITKKTCTKDTDCTSTQKCSSGSCVAKDTGGDDDNVDDNVDDDNGSKTLLYVGGGIGAFILLMVIIYVISKN